VAAKPSIDPARMLHEQLESASADLLRSLLSSFIDALMSAEADAICGAPYGMPSPERVNTRNGYRHRDFDTRTGTIDVAIPKLRSGSYFPEWLLERRRAVAWVAAKQAMQHRRWPPPCLPPAQTPAECVATTSPSLRRPPSGVPLRGRIEGRMSSGCHWTGPTPANPSRHSGGVGVCGRAPAS
jgi:hypothetical protein